MRNLRRALLFVPAKEKQLEKLSTIQCDCFILDLEDSIAPEGKTEARSALLKYFTSVKQNDSEIMVRVNSLDSDYGPEDIRQLRSLNPDTYVLPKADEKSVLSLSKILDEASSNSAIIPLIESAYSLCNIGKIIESSNRVDGVIFGAEDYAADMGIRRTKEGREIEYPRNCIAVACAAKGIEAYDTPFTDFKDDEGLRLDAENAKAAGMKGKTCIHPDQIDRVNKVFSPTEEEVAEAELIVRISKEKGTGAFQINGRMIDAPIIAGAKRIVEISRVINGRK